MMAILGMLLKIIGILLLVILGILLTVIVIVLFFPIQYKVNVEKYEQLNVIVDLNLFYICQIHYCAEEKMLIIKVFGITIKRIPLEQEEDTKQVEEINKKNKVANKKEKQTTQTNTPLSPEEQAAKEKEAKLLEALEKVKVSSEIKVATPAKEEAEKEPNKKKAQKAKKAKKDEKEKKEKTDWFGIAKTLWTDPERKPFVKETFNLVKKLIKYLFPSIAYFHLIIGKEYPDETGELMAKLAVLYPLVGKYGDIEGNYNEQGVWGRIKFKSKIRLAKILQIMLAFVLKKSVRNYIKTLLSIGKVEKNGI